MIAPFTYFMIPLSGAFYMVGWISEQYRYYLMFNPLPHVFEIIRYGVFPSATLEYVDFGYLNASTAILTLFGLLMQRSVKSRIHLS
jgi:capsular polysaccharide transport system permease protein